MLPSLNKFLPIIVLQAGLNICHITAVAQIIPRPERLEPELPSEIPDEDESPQLDIVPPAPTPTPSNLPPTEDKIKIEGFEFINNTAFSDEALNAAVENYLGRELSFTELLEVETTITNLYVTNGYVNSGAVITADQTIPASGGIVRVTIIEGGIEEIIITGNRHLKSEYIRSRIGLAVQTPLNQNRLLEALQLLQLNPRIENISAKLSPGVNPNLSRLEVTVIEARAFNGNIILDNGRNPSVGSFRRGIRLGSNNLLGFGDTISATYINTSGSNAADLIYAIPVSPHNTTISLAGGYSGSEVIDRIFDDLDITGEYFYYELSVRHPLIEKPNEELALGLTLSRQKTKNFLLGEGFPLSLGADDFGEIEISAIRFFQDYVKRSSQDVFALSSRFSIGLDAFNSTINDENIPDSRFFIWRGRGQYVRLLAPETLLVIRSDLQFSTEPLLALEQISIGGLGSVRGYRQDFLLTDNGFFLSAEVRIPIVRASKIDGILQIAPFIDYGVGWNNGIFPDPDPKSIVGVGFGFIWQMGNRLNARVDWGIPLVSTDGIDQNSLNSQGIYLSLDVAF